MNPKIRWVVYGILVLFTSWILWFDWGIAAVWPSLVAIALAIVSRRILLSLVLGAFAGSLLLADGNGLRACFQLVDDHLLPNFGSSWKTGAFIFTLLIGGFVGILEGSGRLQSVLRVWIDRRGRRGVEGSASLFGLVCFFDGLANSLLVGKLYRSHADRAGVSRARLAYIVDTTSAAVACLAFVSTWIAYQLSMIRAGYELAGRADEVQPYRLFFDSLPYNFYAWLALALLGMLVVFQFDFGPMKRFSPKGGPKREVEADVETEESELESHWLVAFLPVFVLVVFVMVGLYVDGIGQLGGELWPLRLDQLALAFGEANAPVVLILGSLFASGVAYFGYPSGRRSAAIEAFENGVLSLFKPALILVGAWMLSSVLNELGAASYLSGLLKNDFPLLIFPVSVFLLGSLISFTTGTSWGTMGILMPLVIPMGFELYGIGLDAEAMIPVLIGAVFSGAVFGDHCSPISDTTLVSSIACGIEPLDHVRTQIPYALLAGGAAAFLGFLPAGGAQFSWIQLLLVGFLFLFPTFFLLRCLKCNVN